jgi:hypothetical protein
VFPAVSVANQLTVSGFPSGSAGVVVETVAPGEPLNVAVVPPRQLPAPGAQAPLILYVIEAMPAVGPVALKVTVGPVGPFHHGLLPAVPGFTVLLRPLGGVLV